MYQMISSESEKLDITFKIVDCYLNASNYAKAIELSNTLSDYVNRNRVIVKIAIAFLNNGSVEDALKIALEMSPEDAKIASKTPYELKKSSVLLKIVLAFLQSNTT